MEDEYLVVIDGKPQGPFTIEQLKGLNIGPGTFVKTRTMKDYKEVGEVEELCRLFGFSHQAIARPQYYASPDVRMLAVVIDYLLILVVYAVILVIIVSFIESKYLKIAVSLSGLPLVPITKIIMGIFMEASSRQATFGKSWLAIKVTDEQGRRISLGRSAARNLFKIVPVLTLGIGYLSGFFSKRQQCLHDKLAGTLVIKGRLV